ncbi:MAG: 2-hydroxyacid dehydrogenase [Pseudomonadota bacterium]
MKNVLVIAPMLTTVLPEMRELFNVHVLWETEDQDALIAEVGPSIDAIATDGVVGCTADLMDKCPNATIIGCCSVGYDAVDLEAAKARGLRVTNTPDVLNDAVAELTMALMLGLARQIPQADAYVRAGRWVSDGAFTYTAELTGKTVGILGLGRIGKEIAVRCQAMRMRVVYHGRSEQAHQPYPYYADLTEMARDIDWLIVIAPGTPATRAIVSREVLEALGPEGCVVNVARGSLIDEAAMVEALQGGKLGGAALDVFEAEPNVPDALFAMDNVVLSPHQGSATWKTRKGMGMLVIDNLLAQFEERSLLTPVV